MTGIRPPDQHEVRPGKYVYARERRERSARAPGRFAGRTVAAPPWAPGTAMRCTGPVRRRCQALTRTVAGLSSGGPAAMTSQVSRYAYAVDSYARGYGHARCGRIIRGTERRCRFKDLRHNFGSNLASKGVSSRRSRVRWAMHRRGRPNGTRPSEESLREIASALDSVVSDSFSDSSKVANGGGEPQVLSNHGAGNGGRTRDIHLGKVALYH
jgi:hypothetical protein